MHIFDDSLGEIVSLKVMNKFINKIKNDQTDKITSIENRSEIVQVTASSISTIESSLPLLKQNLHLSKNHEQEFIFLNYYYFL